MVNQQTLQGNWNEIKGKLRSKWGQLSNDDLQEFHGNVDQLVGLIQRKTGEARSSIESYLDEIGDSAASTVSQATEDVREYVHQASDRIQEKSRQAADSIRQGYEEAEQMVRRRPRESAAVCFGAGVLVGVLLGLTMHRS